MKMMKRTNQFIGKGMNPVWDRDEMIVEIRDPELAVILFNVKYIRSWVFYSKRILLLDFSVYQF